MFNLENEIAVISGASRGIGAGIAGKLAQHGCKVIVNYCQSREKAEALVAEIQKSGGEAIPVKADVTQREQVDRMIEIAVKEFGPPTILINNASSPMIHKKIAKTEWAEFLACFETAVKSTHNCCNAVAPLMRKARRGKIVNIVTQYAQGVPPLAMAAYVTAKYALVGFSKSLAVEMAPFGIQVNMVSPGLTDTDLVSGLPDSFKQAIAQQTPLKRITECDDISNAVTFLVSDLADYITGVNLPVCGGNIM
ncbi:MAG: SDR family NAD(P)-dependent oxidoreductase [Nitrospinales bacterium]